MAGLIYHPHREQVLAENHLRPFLPVEFPSRVSFLSFLRSPGEASRMASLIAELCMSHAITPPDDKGQHFHANFGLFQLRWEKHTEFDSLQIYDGQAFDEERPSPGYDQPPFELLPADFVNNLPGTCFLAGHVNITLGNQEADKGVKQHCEGLIDHKIMAAHMGGRRLSLITDFSKHKDGFQRFTVVNHTANAFETGRNVQRLVEIETYRALVLLANPLIRAQEPELSRLSQSLTDIARQIETSAGSAQARDMLDQVLVVESELNKLQAVTAYRLSATEAYAPLVIERLDRMKEDKIPGYQRYSSFLLRRFSPAERNAANLTLRIASVQQRSQRIVNLLQTKLSVEVGQQNQQLLTKMEANARQQYQLQHAVELIGAVAITYYAVSVLGVALKPLELGSLAAWIKAGSIPLFLIGTVLASRWLRRGLESSHP